MLKLPVAFGHAPPLPASDQLPIALPSESVVPTMVPVTELPVGSRVSVFPPDVTVNIIVPFTVLLAIFWVNPGMLPLMVPPLMGKHEFEFRNSKLDMLNESSLFTVNCVLKLKPDALPSPPESCACQSPPLALCAVGLPLPQPLINSASSRIAIRFMSIPSSRIPIGLPYA
jgi:hypothetical protein